MLPVAEVYPRVVEALKDHKITLLQAPPGAGKSTWLPLQLVLDGHFQHIIMLEPRRIAARNIASYLAKCQSENLGESIGLRIRQEKYIGKNTKLEIVTEGMLTRMLQNDAELTGVDCIIFDEFHERSIAADTALAFAIETQTVLRDDLKILLMSATLDADRICQKFNCPVITSEGRSYPIEEIYAPVKNETRWLDEIPSVIKRAMDEQPGSCLVFLPGQKEINRVAQSLSGLDENVKICPLYGDQAKEVQHNAIAPAITGERKVVLATNVAETSLTIEGIRIVIDCGRKRTAKFNLNTGVTELKTVNVSVASAIQRAGRAGRIEPGVVYRLGSKETFKRREAHDTPEILCSDISALLLETKKWGAHINDLELLDTPSSAQQNQALDLLSMLEAIDNNGKITPLGIQVLELGTDIRWAHMLVKAKLLEPKLSGIEALSIYLVALLESRTNREPELITALQSQIRSSHPAFAHQLKFWLKRLNKTPSKSLNVSYLPLLLALAYPDRIAKKRGEGYLLSNGAGVDCRNDYWQNDTFIAIAELGGKNGTHIFSATAVDVNPLRNYLPYLFKNTNVCEFNEKTSRFIHENRVTVGAIVVESKPIHTGIDDSVRVSAWIDLIHNKGFSVFDAYTNNPAERDRNPFIQLLIRMTLACQYFPEEYPEIGEQHLLASLEHWISPYLQGVKNIDQLKKLNIVEPLKNCFDWNEMQQLDTLFPHHIKVPSGSNIPITYQYTGPAKLSVRMQEVYGLSSSPTLAKGKLPLLIDLLSPAHRSLQLTQDLEGFWKGSYGDIQKEMKGRYPRHFWPDNPETAIATSKTKKKMMTQSEGRN
ncbi:MAG: ATP-dependent helicase HrpB [Agarilytica sp.]